MQDEEKMKTPRRQARSSVTSRRVASPGWIAGKDKVFSPKSPSPVRRVTRRSSIFQSKTARSDIAKFKMPASLKSPPGAKTRARRSSVYQKGGRNLSPRNLPVSSRTRRSSIYVRGTAADTEFSKVFRTPIKPVEPVKPITIKAEVHVASNLNNEGKRKAASKQAAHASPSPVKQVKSSPAIPKKKSPVVKVSPLRSLMSPVKLNKSPGNKLKTPKTVGKTPKSVKCAATKTPLPKHKTPVLDVKSPASLKKTEANKLKTPRVTKSARKSPKSAKKIVQDTQAGGDAAKKLLMSVKEPKASSTPSKTVEQITNKSFYGTPQETLTRNDDLIVFSAKPASAAKPRQKKTTLKTPKVNSARKSSPKRMPARKTPAVKRHFVESEEDSTPVEVKARKIEKEAQSSRRKVQKKVEKLDGEVQKEIESEKETLQKTKLKLSPVEMISVLKSVHEEEREEKRKAEESPEERPSKIARLTGELTTPRMKKVAKRASPKKLTEIAEKREMLKEEWVSETDSSILNDTFNTDSRSSRCIIL